MVASGSLALNGAMFVWLVVLLRIAGELVTSLATGARFWVVARVAVLLAVVLSNIELVYPAVPDTEFDAGMVNVTLFGTDMLSGRGEMVENETRPVVLL